MHPTPTTLLRRAAVVTVLAAAVLALAVGPADAHAAFVASQPEPGTQLTAAPGLVQIEFSEPLIADLSSVRITDPDGTVWERTGVSERMMQARLGTNTPGVYTVEWRTVSPLDGHTLRGTYRFGVGVTPSDVDSTATVEPGTADVVLAIGRAAEYAGLLTAVGMLLVVALARRRPSLRWVRPGVAAALAVALLAGAAVTLGEALLAASSPSLSAVGRYLGAEPGVPRLARLGAETVALVAVRTGARRTAAGATVAAVVALAAAGHAAATRPSWWGVTVDAVHLVAAGAWAGAILGFTTFRPPDGWRGDAARELLARFSPVAIAAFVATVATGTLRGSQELSGFGDLVATSYGQVLLLKVVAVALMVPFSLRAWRRRDARPRAEGAVAVVVIGAAALLAAYPVPPQRAEEDALLAAGARENPAIPEAGDLTLAGEAGDVLVGLSLRPGRPGRNDVLVYLLPPSGEADARDLDAELVVGGDVQPLERCGRACRRGVAVLDGGEDVSVRLEGVAGDPARFALPDLPAPDGSDLLERAVRRMDRLRSVRYREVFGPVDPPIVSEAAIAAPDRIRFHIETFDRTTVRIGDASYRREGGAAWEVERGGATVQVPVFVWDYTPRVAAHVVGEDRLDGVPVRTLSFFIDHGSGPIWYRLWVDGDALVRRAEMRAQGHFMDHEYFDFDAPVDIEPPVPATGAAP